MAHDELNAERRRLEQQREGIEDWRLWGPYLAERAWGTVREDYSAHGTAWEHLDHDQARSRAYRWNEDGLGGICDEGQALCLAMALWNGRDPILKERPFGLTGNQGNRGEDVKEYYFYRDATPSHSYLHYLYKYPQAEYPYAWLLEENGRRGRQDPALSLLDTGVFSGGRYWDLDVVYAKAWPTEIHCRIHLHNRGPEAAEIHCLPTLWFRNTWSCAGEATDRPSMRAVEAPAGAAWAMVADHPELGTYYLYGAEVAELLFTDNESNTARLWGAANANPYVKDAFHRRVIEFLSDHGVRSVSRIHATQRDLGSIPGLGQATIEYVPGESNSGLFGGNSNWRGPVWMPTNYTLVQALEKYHRFLGDAFTVSVPGLGGQELTLKEIAHLIAERLVGLYREGPDGVVPAMRRDAIFRDDPHWAGLYLFYEYFDGETGQGLGATHQTGWTGLIANLVMRRYREDIPEYWRSQKVTS